MKVKVLRDFIDKYSKILHKKGTYIDATSQRVEEINSTPAGVLVKVEYVQLGLGTMTKKELIQLARDRGIDLDGRMTKAEMIKELM